METDAKHVFQNYTRQPIVIEKGRGALVWDEEDNEYVDCVSGIAVNNVGHCHPQVVKAIQEQAAQLIHSSNLYYIRNQANLAAKITEHSGMDHAFFCNSGTEAVEAALKLARRATGKTDFIATENCFHGRTMGALSVTHKEKYREPFEPLIPGASFVPYDDPKAIETAITDRTAAVILEPIQGEGGVRIPRDDYLVRVREICDDHDVLLILDEVQTGWARTGEWFGWMHSGARPDILCMAKSLGGGFPIGAIASREDLEFEKGDHGTTFGGNPLACAAALAAIQVMEDEDLVQRSRRLGAYMREQLVEHCDHEYVKEIRGKGLMIGMELTHKCDKYVEMARSEGVLLNCTADRVLRFVPPLVITKEQIDRVVRLLA